MDFKDPRYVLLVVVIFIFFTQVNSIPLIEGIEPENECVGTVADENSAYSGQVCGEAHAQVLNNGGLDIMIIGVKYYRVCISIK